MRRLLMILLLCLLPLTALAEDVWVTRDNLLAWGAGDMPMDMPVAVKPGFEEAAKALLAEHPGWPMEAVLANLKDWLGDALTGGLTVDGIDLHRSELILLLTQPDSPSTLRIATWNGQSYDFVDNHTLPAGTSLDSSHIDEDGRVGFWYPYTAEEWTYAEFRRGVGGWWNLASSHNGVAFHASWAGISNDPFALRHLRVGTYSWGDLRTIDVAAIPLDFDLALSFRSTKGWAVVNNPNPEDRLHLRTKPDKDAASLGKFYNGTPVIVLETKGAWNRVQIGLDGLEGWMMTQYLAFGDAMDKVASAYPELAFSDAEDAVPVHAVLREPQNNASVAWVMDAAVRGVYDWALIGVSGDQWYILMDELGRVGYVPQAWFSPGNG